MPVYYVGFFNSTFVNLWGVDVTYWPTGQIGLLIQSFTNRVKSFFIVHMPICFKTWVLDLASVQHIVPFILSGTVDGSDLICWVIWNFYCWDFLHHLKRNMMNVICFVSLSHVESAVQSLGDTDISVEMKVENFLSLDKGYSTANSG